MIMGIVLLFAVWLDGRWVKNRHKAIDSTYVSPAYLKLPECPNAEAGALGVYSVNDALRNAEPVGLGEVEGPEDVLIDRSGNLYSGSRHGEIHRWFAPDFKRHEIFAHVGGATLGMNFDKDDNLVVCVGGMGLYMVTPARKALFVLLHWNGPCHPEQLLTDRRMELSKASMYRNLKVFIELGVAQEIRPGEYDLTCLPLRVAGADGEVRLAWQDSTNGAFRWNTLVRASHDAGVSWDPAVDVSFYSDNGARVFALQSDRLTDVLSGKNVSRFQFRLSVRNPGLACVQLTAAPEAEPTESKSTVPAPAKL